jgi:uncharacterized RDD family membrane protein YckC
MSEPEVRYAGWGRRAAAFIIDWVILYVLDAVVILVGAGVGSAVGGTSGGYAGLFLGALAAFILFGGYWVYGEGRPAGQTFGKRMVGIRVRAVSGGPAGYGRALGRNAFMFVLFVIVLPASVLDLLWPLWDSQKQCLHDKVASTFVVLD